ncbi:methyltransferase domain-containing protein [Halobacteriaceae archaeon SHR40]|uniref:class I SAM-dependent methyltransferase n=1 Tax=Halovenus amylolytica TaxID=2500550 RepID=UPI000FE383A7
MGFHTFDPAKIDRLEDPSRFRFCSREELLGALPTGPATRILEVGSGSGFYTDEVAPFVGQVCGVDLQPAMHGRYAERGVPANVALVTAGADVLPFPDGTFDGSFSTMTFHESASESSLDELARVIDGGGRVVFVDWSRAGRGESGPPVEERYDAESAAAMLSDAGFDIVTARERSETFKLVGER